MGRCVPPPGVCRVVHAVIPKGPADGHLEAGDVLIEVNGLCCTTFLPLAECFDSHVNKPVKLRLQRGGEVSQSVSTTHLQCSRDRIT